MSERRAHHEQTILSRRDLTRFHCVGEPIFDFLGGQPLFLGHFWGVWPVFQKLSVRYCLLTSFATFKIWLVNSMFCGWSNVVAKNWLRNEYSASKMSGGSLLQLAKRLDLRGFSILGSFWVGGDFFENSQFFKILRF